MVNDHTGIIDQTLQQFHAHWAAILQLPTDQRQVVYDSQVLRPQVESAFGGAMPGWLSACYHSPDVMIAASSPDAIKRGEYQFVLGELHVSVNTLRVSCFVAQHPNPQDLFTALEQDITKPRVTLIEDKQWDEFSERSRVALVSSKDYRLAFADVPVDVQNEQLLPIGSMIVTETSDGLVARTRDGQRSFDIIEIFADTLSIIIASSFSLLPPRPHMPRIVIDRLVVSRERWHFEATELDFAFENNLAVKVPPPMNLSTFSLLVTNAAVSKKLDGA